MTVPTKEGNLAGSTDQVVSWKTHPTQAKQFGPEFLNIEVGLGSDYRSRNHGGLNGTVVFSGLK